MTGAKKKKLSMTGLFCYLTNEMLLLNACSMAWPGGTAPSPAYVELPYTELVLDELAPDALAGPGIPGCSLADLRPFGWKEVDSGLVDIRTPEDYVLQTSSLYQEGYLDYLQTRLAYPDTYQSIPAMDYETYLATCNVFPDVDFARFSLLGYQGVGSGCMVTFEKDVIRDDQNKQVIYQLEIIEEGSCQTAVSNRNLILVPAVPAEYEVVFLPLS
jgi:hypothetical protein